MNRRAVLQFGLSAAAVLAAPGAFAQGAFPSRPIKLVVPFSAGGVNDIVGRQWAERVKPLLGSVFIENMGGAGGTLGVMEVQRAEPDGHTILLGSTSTMVLNTMNAVKVAYDPLKDFVPIAIFCVSTTSIAVHPSVPAKNVQELTAWVKANPDKAIYASSGPGSSLHMAAELYMQMTGTRMHHVPYKGSWAAHPDLLAGRTAMIFDTITAIRGHVKAGTLRGIAVTTLKRASSMPELPTMAESGLPGYDAATWGGILAPAGTPKAVVARLNGAINAALKEDDVGARLGGAGIEIQGGTPEAFGAVIKAEVDKWGRIVKQAGIQPE